jgi:hypothetical protein
MFTYLFIVEPGGENSAAARLHSRAQMSKVSLELHQIPECIG